MELILTKEHTEQIAKQRCEKLIAERNRYRDALERIKPQNEVETAEVTCAMNYAIAKKALEQSDET